MKVVKQPVPLRLLKIHVSATNIFVFENQSKAMFFPPLLATFLYSIVVCKVASRQTDSVDAPSNQTYLMSFYVSATPPAAVIKQALEPDIVGSTTVPKALAGLDENESVRFGTLPFVSVAQSVIFRAVIF